MADSIRLAVLKQLCTYLETEVTEANDYPYTLTGAVYRGRLLFSAEDPCPNISFLEGLNADREPVTPGEGHDEQVDNWVVLIKGLVPDDKNNPTDPAHQLLASVKQALALLNKRIAPTEGNTEFKGQALEFVRKIGVEPGTVRPAVEPTERASMFLRVVVELVEPLDDPFFTP